MTGTDSTNFTWVGRQGYVSDTETGLCLLGSGTRYYDSTTASFLSKDPTGFSGRDSNLYRYATNRPTQFVDPTGRRSLEITTVGPPVSEKVPCGLFKWFVKFTVHTVSGGFIVQHLRAVTKSEDCCGDQAYTTFNEFWEAWVVDENGQVLGEPPIAQNGWSNYQVGGHARFRPLFSRGEIHMAGETWFIEGQRLEGTGLEPGTVPEALGLPSSYTPPLVNWINAGLDQPIIRSIDVFWNCCRGVGSPGEQLSDLEAIIC
jgi:RHS repeat-associated protein